MAIYHLSAQVLSRSRGRSAVACAAYRSGEKLYDERYERTQDYTRRDRVAEAFIIAPEGAPEWARMRERLWNEVEAKENRKDSQLAREFNIALPRELSPEERKALISEYVKREFVDRGMVADVAIHEAPHRGDQRNHHAHVMLTMRDIGPEGFTKKNLEWNARTFLQEAREVWAEAANRYLERAGHEGRIDHRSLEAQRQEALERGQYMRAIDLARAPQGKVGIGRHIERRRGQSYVHKAQTKERALELAEYRQARRESLSLLRIARGAGLEAVERELGDEMRAINEPPKEIERQGSEVEDRLNRGYVEPDSHTVEKAPERIEPAPQREHDLYERARTDRVFLNTFYEYASKEWNEVYEGTKKSIVAEITEGQKEERKLVAQWEQREKEIGQNIPRIRGGLERERFRGRESDVGEAIRGLEQRRASLQEALREKYKHLDAELDPVRLDKLAKTRMAEEVPELASRQDTLERIRQANREHDEKERRRKAEKEEQQRMGLARKDRSYYKTLTEQTKVEWEATWKERQGEAREHVIQRQPQDYERLAVLGKSISDCDAYLERVEGEVKKNRVLMFLSTRKERDELNAEVDRVKDIKQDCATERDQLSRRLEVEIVQEAVSIASKDNPELVKRWFALEEIGKEWHQRDIRELELQQKQEMGKQQKQGPELELGIDLGRPDVKKERDRGRGDPDLEL